MEITQEKWDNFKKWIAEEWEEFNEQANSEIVSPT